MQHNARRQTQPEPILTDTYKAEVTYPAIEPPAGLKGLKINRVIATHMHPDHCGMAGKTSESEVMIGRSLWGMGILPSTPAYIARI